MKYKSLPSQDNGATFTRHETSTNQKYDIVGDVHGYATKLKFLLEKLGYREKKGVYSHPERKVIFVGDFIDRGPEIRATLQIARAMVDGGSALADHGQS